MPTYGPAYELQRRMIEVLRADSALQELLFPLWNPTPVSPDDTRVYGSRPKIGNPKLLVVLPRIIVECQADTHDFEQNDITLSAPINVWLHSLTPKDQYDHAELMDARIRTIFGSTGLSNSRIIGADLYDVGGRRYFTETSFNDANRIVSEFAVASVGVLAE